MNAYIKHSYASSKGRKFTSKGEKREFELMQILIQSKNIRVENTFLADMYFDKFDKNMFQGLIPIIKIEKGKYMIGTEKKQVVVKNDSLIVRIGGGFESMDRYIDHISRPECLKINHTMRQKNLDYTETVCSYLDGIKAGDKVKDSYRNGK